MNYTNYQKLFYEQVYKWEKGFVNDPYDLGGLTNDGITFIFFKANALKVLNLEPTYKNFTNLKYQDIIAFYNYIFIKSELLKINSSIIQGACFDFIINSGKAKLKIQEMLKDKGFNIELDGIFGDKTFSAINDFVTKVGEEKALSDIMEKRLNYVVSLTIKMPTQKKFLKGWLNRINDWNNFLKNLLKNK